MRLFFIILITSLITAQEIKVSSVERLEEIFSEKVNNISVYLEPGDYYLTGRTIVDSSCGNCQNPDTLIPASAGLVIRGKNIKLFGPSDHSAIIHNNAGYGIYILNSEEVEISSLTITGGERDESGAATDAGLVVKNSDVLIENNIIRDNIGDSATVVKNVVGIMGICGRENSDMIIRNNSILRNSWDGITLYRDAEAKITNNIIDGIDKATSKIAGGGRGVALGVTWNATAEIKGNLLRRYWKGIGIFVDAEAVVEYNIIEDMITWGIAYWDAGKGNPVGFINNNIVYQTGACGISVARENEGVVTGELKNNVIVLTGQNPKYDSPDYYCAQCALAIYAKPESFDVANNLFFDNRRATEDLPDFDLEEGDFLDKYSKWESNFANAYYDESFFKKYLSKQNE